MLWPPEIYTHENYTANALGVCVCVLVCASGMPLGTSATPLNKQHLTTEKWLYEHQK